MCTICYGLVPFMAAAFISFMTFWAGMLAGIWCSLQWQMWSGQMWLWQMWYQALVAKVAFIIGLVALMVTTFIILLIKFISFYAEISTGICLICNHIYHCS